MRSLLPILLLAPLAHTDGASCRQDMRPTDWVAVRVMRAATDPAPITGLHIDYCFAFEQTVQLENLWLFGGTRWAVSNLSIVVEASFDPNFAPGFELIPPTTLTLPDVHGSVGPYDLSLDFAGTSGESIPQSTQALLVADLAVTDDAFFRTDWPVYLRTTTQAWTQSSNSPAMVFQTIAQAGGGLAVTYVH